MSALADRAVGLGLTALVTEEIARGKLPGVTEAEAAEAAVGAIARVAATARRPEVVGGIGAFAGFFRWGGAGGGLLAATCDGVGTKLAVALERDALETAGWDLVAMNVNDLVVHGA